MARYNKKQVAEPAWSDNWKRTGPIILVVAALACYWFPLLSPDASIQWDSADSHRPFQSYLSQELHAGRIPFWSPYPFSGYPFFSDPQVGAWYPLNWPFFAIGVRPRIMVVEHFLHVLLACFGAYFLAHRFVRHRPAAVLAGLCYGLSGFFVAHSSHTTMLQTAAWLPWLLVLFDRAVESETLRSNTWAILAAGVMILAGQFQTSLYAFWGLGLFSIVRAFQNQGRRIHIFGLALAIPIGGALISSVSTLPGLQLLAESVRASLSAMGHHEGQMPARALLTLIYPNYYGVFSDYHGPEDITQYYYYAGVLLIPLAILGLRNRTLRWIAFALIVPTVWYAIGHSAALYEVIARLPGFSGIRSPVHVWFVPTLALALLAGSGFADLCQRWPVKWLPGVLIAFTCLDLFICQSALNPLAYARESYEQRYQVFEDGFRTLITAQLPPLTRFGSPSYPYDAGPLAHYLDTRTEVTYGYNPLTLSRYSDYEEAMKTNTSLRAGLCVSKWYDFSQSASFLDQVPLPRATFPRALAPVHSLDDSRQKLLFLNQAHTALVPDNTFVSQQDGHGLAEVRQMSPGHYRIHYRCATPSLLRVSNAYFPGWTASVSGRRLEVVPVDHALMGAVVPAGENDVDFDFHPTYFWPGLVLTLCSVAVCGWLLLKTYTPARIAIPGLRRRYS